MRTCREDGVLVKPDAPIAAIDRCFLRHGHLTPSLLVGETFSRVTARIAGTTSSRCTPARGASR